jgi:peptide/nickel transport system substrate-binding protein
VIKNPQVDCHRLRPYFEFIDSVVLYEENPRKVTFVCGEKYMRAEATTGIFEIIPPHVYDPDSLMRHFTVSQLDRQGNKLADNEKIKAFAESFNSEKFQREKGYIKGSGPYSFQHWKTQQEILLKRKEEWWGDQLQPPPNEYFEANAPELLYKTINDQTTALVALKNEELDVMKGISPRDFVELSESEKFSSNFDPYTQNSLAYYYLGLNTKRDKLSDRRVRMALAYLGDVEKLIDKVFYGLAESLVGPIHPSRQQAYNDTLTPYGYSPDNADSLMTAAGWVDSNGDGIREKKINGQVTDFQVEFLYNSGNDQRKQIGLILQEEARKVGIEVNVRPKEGSAFIKSLKNHDFDICCSAWSASAIPSDPKQIWHSDSYENGSNYVGFGDAESDAIIEQIRRTLDSDKRAHLYRKLQQKIHHQVPYVFLFTPKRRMAIHKRFDNVHASVLRPGYWVPAFQLRKDRSSTQAGPK